MTTCSYVDQNLYIDNVYQYYYNFELVLMVFRTRIYLATNLEADQGRLLIY